MIRSPKREELPVIAKFIDACWRVSYHSMIAPDYLDALDTQARTQRLVTAYDEGSKHFFVTHCDDEIIGVSIYGKSINEKYPKAGEIFAVYVDSAHQDRGHGHNLLMHAEAALKDEGYESVILSVLSQNTQAIDFYCSHGYRCIGKDSLVLGEAEYEIDIMLKEMKVQVV